MARWLALSVMLIGAGVTAEAQVPGILNYQGRVVVNNTNFNGTAQFKFALVDGRTGVAHWSNNNSSVNGSEPTASFAVAVSNGLYSVLLGSGIMAPVPATVFANQDVRLRVWFNDGVNGFQLLSPDQRIGAVGYALTAANVPDAAITSAKLANGAVTNTKIAGGAVDTPELADNAVMSSKILDNSVQSADLTDGAVATVDLADGAVTSTKLAPGAIGTTGLADDAVTAAKLADNAVFANHIASSAVGASELAGASVGAVHLQAGAVNDTKILDGAVTTAKLANGTVTAGKIANFTITGTQIAGGAIGPAELAAGAVINPVLADNAVTGVKIADGTIGAADLGIGSVGASEIFDGSVGTLELQDNAVTSAKINNGAVTGAKIADGTITSADVANGAVTTAKVATRPAMRLSYPGTAQAVQGTANGGSIVTFSAEDFDTANMHDPATNAERLVAPVDGLYHITIRFTWATTGNNSSYRALGVEKFAAASAQFIFLGNDRRLPLDSTHAIPGGQDQGRMNNECNGLVALRAGDYIRASVSHNEAIGGIQPSGHAGGSSMHWVAPHP